LAVKFKPENIFFLNFRKQSAFLTAPNLNRNLNPDPGFEAIKITIGLRPPKAPQMGHIPHPPVQPWDNRQDFQEESPADKDMARILLN